jgi:cytosine deaminase
MTHSAPLPGPHPAPLPATLPVPELLAVAREEARLGLAEGGIPIGAALFHRDGTLLGRGHNRRVQDGDPSMHAETSAFRNAGRLRGYRDTIMVTTLSPCWYCSGLVRQFGIGHVLIGEAVTFQGGHDWLAEHGVDVTLLEDAECIGLMRAFIAERPELWYEDIGE